MTEALLCIPNTHFELFVNFQKSFYVFSEERTNKIVLFLLQLHQLLQTVREEKSDLTSSAYCSSTV